MPRGRRSPLKVVMNGQLVGRLHDAPRGLLASSYAESWLSSEVGRPISLSMLLADRQFSGHVVENFFNNLLPDSQPIRGRLQARVGAESSRCFDLLTYIGRDCVGALQLLPEDEDADVRCIRATPLSEQAIETILQNYRTMPLGIDLGNYGNSIPYSIGERADAHLKRNRWSVGCRERTTALPLTLPSAPGGAIINNMKPFDEFLPQIHTITNRHGAFNVRLFGSMAKGNATASMVLIY